MAAEDSSGKSTGKSRRSAMCQGKQKFDRSTAGRVVRETTKVKLERYECPFCGHWHIGSQALPTRIEETRK